MFISFVYVKLKERLVIHCRVSNLTLYCILGGKNSNKMWASSVAKCMVYD